MTQPPSTEILFELKRIGNAVQVSAIDPATGTEVAIVGDPRVGEEMLKRTAARKLAYVIAKNARRSK